MDPRAGTAELDVTVLFDVLSRVKDGDFDIRMPRDRTGAAGKVAETLNDVIAANQALGAELARVSRAVDDGQCEREARQEAQRDRLAFEEAPISSAFTDPDGVIQRVNHATCQLTGRAAGELVGMRCSAIAHPEDRSASLAAIAEILAGSVRTHRLDNRYLHRSGRVIEARTAITAIRDDDGRVVQLFAQIEDLTDARRATRELEQAQFETLARLAAAAELRDDDTGQHTRRVGELSAALAEGLGLPEAVTKLIRLAAPLHDIGKLAIRDGILSKPGKLTAAEVEHMKTHSAVGAQILAGGEFALLEMAEQIALTHHERWDGSGYPAGLRGDAIPIAGRIVAVADVFDALTHSRSYKRAWSKDAAVAELTRQAGRQFDPEVVAAFLHRDFEEQPVGDGRRVTRERLHGAVSTQCMNA